MYKKNICQIFPERCPHCRKTFVSRDHEDPGKFVVKIRFLTFQANEDFVFAKCRHCGHMIKIQFLRPINY